jgi:hypothetical protein
MTEIRGPGGWDPPYYSGPRDAPAQDATTGRSEAAAGRDPFDLQAANVPEAEATPLDVP